MRGEIFIISFDGFLRDNGTVGVRNHVAIVAAQGYGNTVVEAIASIVHGVYPVIHPYGRGQIGPDARQQSRTLAGTILNPNVYGAVIVAWEPVEAQKIYKLVREKSNKKVEIVTIMGQGTLKAIEQGARIALDMLVEASGLKREKAPIDKLLIAVNCGASDATSGIVANPATGYVCDKLINLGGTAIFGETAEIMGAEHILARRSSPEVGRRLLEIVKEVEDYVLSLGIDIRGNQPKPDNIEGGLTTVEEKALGNIAKAGSHPVERVISYGEAPAGKGLYHMYSSPAGAESNTGFFACGAQITIFTTGKGNPVGHVLGPVIKVTGNHRTVSAAPENIDLDISAVLKGQMDIDEAGEHLFSFLLKVASGKITKSEALKHSEFAISRIGLTV
ncbi:MAG: UxaA family hydrolase [Bacillota bacterium]